MLAWDADLVWDHAQEEIRSISLVALWRRPMRMQISTQLQCRKKADMSIVKSARRAPSIHLNIYDDI